MHAVKMCLPAVGSSSPQSLVAKLSKVRALSFFNKRYKRLDHHLTTVNHIQLLTVHYSGALSHTQLTLIKTVVDELQRNTVVKEGKERGRVGRGAGCCFWFASVNGTLEVLVRANLSGKFTVTRLLTYQ